MYSDVDHLGLADVWWADLATGETRRAGDRRRRRDGFDLPERPGTAPLRVDRDGLDLAITDDDAGTRLVARRGPNATAGRVASTSPSRCRPATSRSTS